MGDKDGGVHYVHPACGSDVLTLWILRRVKRRMSPLDEPQRRHPHAGTIPQLDYVPAPRGGQPGVKGVFALRTLICQQLSSRCADDCDARQADSTRRPCPLLRPFRHLSAVFSLRYLPRKTFPGPLGGRTASEKGPAARNAAGNRFGVDEDEDQLMRVVRAWLRACRFLSG